MAGGAQIDPQDDSRVPCSFAFGSYLAAARPLWWAARKSGAEPPHSKKSRSEFADVECGGLTPLCFL